MAQWICLRQVCRATIHTCTSRVLGTSSQSQDLSVNCIVRDAKRAVRSPTLWSTFFWGGTTARTFSTRITLTRESGGGCPSAPLTSDQCVTGDVHEHSSPCRTGNGPMDRQGRLSVLAMQSPDGDTPTATNSPESTTYLFLHVYPPVHYGR